MESKASKGGLLRFRSFKSLLNGLCCRTFSFPTSRVSSGAQTSARRSREGDDSHAGNHGIKFSCRPDAYLGLGCSSICSVAVLPRRISSLPLRVHLEDYQAEKAQRISAFSRIGPTGASK